MAEMLYGSRTWWITLFRSHHSAGKQCVCVMVFFYLHRIPISCDTRYERQKAQWIYCAAEEKLVFHSYGNGTNHTEKERGEAELHKREPSRSECIFTLNIDQVLLVCFDNLMIRSFSFFSPFDCSVFENGSRTAGTVTHKRCQSFCRGRRRHRRLFSF